MSRKEYASRYVAPAIDDPAAQLRRVERIEQLLAELTAEVGQLQGSGSTKTLLRRFEVAGFAISRIRAGTERALRNERGRAW